jgi:hypothetical protein
MRRFAIAVAAVLGIGAVVFVPGVSASAQSTCSTSDTGYFTSTYTGHSDYSQGSANTLSFDFAHTTKFCIEPVGNGSYRYYINLTDLCMVYQGSGQPVIFDSGDCTDVLSEWVPYVVINQTTGNGYTALRNVAGDNCLNGIGVGPYGEDSYDSPCQDTSSGVPDTNQAFLAYGSAPYGP